MQLSMALEARTALERIGDGEVAGAIEGVDAERARLARHDAVVLFLLVLVHVEARHAVHGDARAVERRADLPRAEEAVAVPEEAARGARAAHVALHRVLRMRLPLAQQALARIEVQLLVELAALDGGV